MNIKTHYDLLIEENNDPFRDPPALRQHMESWDGQVFLDLMELDPSKTVLEIGVGTGRIAGNTAGCCRQNVIQDRTIYEDAYVFAENLHDMRLLDTRDFENYLGMFEKMSSLISPPDLLIYLKANVSTLLEQIRKRGRAYEQGISPEYLTRLNEKYEKWTSSYKLGKILTVDIDNLNFPNRPEDLDKLITLIDNTLDTK